jgi:tetratricopeptide (TPR) repeat protein
MASAQPPIELNLSFPDPDHVVLSVGRTGSGTLPFANPISRADRGYLSWYVETYGAHSLGDPDDDEARRIAALLPVWGRRLFAAVFSESVALRLFQRLQDTRERDRILTISAEHPAILALPWELLHDSAPNGGFLFHDHPPISIRRTVAGATDGIAPIAIAAKEHLHLLFVISRPARTGFLDPRADSKAVLDALDAHAPGSVSWEFLRPPTLDRLIERLEDTRRPPVDIIHFDGHGVFDREGNLPGRLEKDVAGRHGGAEFLRQKETGQGAGPRDTGYLLFETPDGEIDLVAAGKLGQNLHRHRVALVILSACQSAAMAEEGGTQKPDEDAQEEVERPMGSVAARLTATGIPAVLAMTHSVLVPTTRLLFGAFYKDLAREKRVGEALDNARRHLSNHPERYEIQRGPKRVWLRLQDWFLPALYQAGEDAPLLLGRAENELPAAPQLRTNLRPAPEEGFFGRRRELWQIECWFAGKTRRITITGFGGQGKTALAEEAGRWLIRARFFEAAVFVDYSRMQPLDALGAAVSYIGTVLGESLVDADATAVALRKTAALIILDNLEALAAEPLRELLDAAAAWSEAGGSRVLCTTRRPDLEHPQYRTEGTLVHRRLTLAGLGGRQWPDDALEWFAELSKLPPAPVSGRPLRADLIDLFERVRFHPLSIRMLTQQLKTRDAKALGARLDLLLAEAATGEGLTATDDTPAGLLASLRLSLDHLDAAARALLPRLGVFQGGAFEDDLLAITEIPAAEWQPLRHQLEAAGLIEAESIEGVVPPYLRFHPTLAPMLWAGLSTGEKTAFAYAHRRRYGGLANFLYEADKRRPHQARAIARREVPNLLHAGHALLDAGEPDAVNVVDSLNKFLSLFGLRKEAQALLSKAQSTAASPGSENWRLAQTNRGEELMRSGNIASAAEVFAGILRSLGESTTYGRAATLLRLGRCSIALGRSDLAVQQAREALSVLDVLEPSDDAKRLRTAGLGDMGNALRKLGKFAAAREAFEARIVPNKELNDLASQAVTLGQLGNLALEQGQLDEAQGRFRAALALSQELGDRRMEEVSWHQLGRVFQEGRNWDEAERHYRESARICEEEGDLAGAAITWSQLAALSQVAGRPDAAESWGRKAMGAFRQLNSPADLSLSLNNLALLLARQPQRLAEARGLAEEALAIESTLDPGAVEIWKTYNLLAAVADREAAAATSEPVRDRLLAESREHRRRARQARRSFAGTLFKLRPHALTILGTVAAAREPALWSTVEQMLKNIEERGWMKLVAAIRRILGGERDGDALCEQLDDEDSTIVDAILQGIEDPSSLRDLMPKPEPTAGG